MFKKTFIEAIIINEFSNKSLTDHALQILDELLKRKTNFEFNETFTIYNLSTLIPNEKLSNDDFYKIAFELATLSLPLFSVLIKFENENGSEFILDNKNEIENILFKENIMHPIYNEYLSYDEYKNDFYFLFKSNYELLNSITSNNEQ